MQNQEQNSHQQQQQDSNSQQNFQNQEDYLFPNVRTERQPQQIQTQRRLTPFQYIDQFLILIANEVFQYPAQLTSNNEDVRLQRIAYFIVFKFYQQDWRSLINISQQNTLIKFKDSNFLFKDSKPYTIQDFFLHVKVWQDTNINRWRAKWQSFYSDSVSKHLAQNKGYVTHDAVTVANILSYITRSNKKYISCKIIGFGHCVEPQKILRILQLCFERVIMLAALDGRMFLIKIGRTSFDFVDCQTQQSLDFQTFYQRIQTFYRRYQQDNETIAINHLSLTFLTDYHPDTITFVSNQIFQTFENQNQKIIHYLQLQQNQNFLFLCMIRNRKLFIILMIIKKKHYDDFAQYVMEEYAKRPQKTLLQQQKEKQQWENLQRKLFIIFLRVYSTYGNDQTCEFSQSFRQICSQTQSKPLRKIFYSIFLNKFNKQKQSLKGHPYIVRKFMTSFIPRDRILHERYIFFVQQLKAVQKHNYFCRIGSQKRQNIFLTVLNKRKQLSVHFPTTQTFLSQMNDQLYFDETINFFLNMNNFNDRIDTQKVEVDLYYPKELSTQFQHHFKKYQLNQNKLWIVEKMIKADIELMNLRFAQHPKTRIVFLKRLIKKLLNQKQVKIIQIKSHYSSIIKQLNQTERIFSNLQVKTFVLIFQMLVINNRIKMLSHLMKIILTKSLKQYFYDLKLQNQGFIKKLMKQMSSESLEQFKIASIIFSTFPKKMVFKHLLVQLYKWFHSFNFNFRNILILAQYKHKIIAIHDIRNEQFIIKYPQSQSLVNCRNADIYNYLKSSNQQNLSQHQRQLQLAFNEQHNYHVYLHIVLLPQQMPNSVHDRNIAKFNLLNSVENSVKSIPGISVNNKSGRCIYQINQIKMQMFGHTTNINQIQIRTKFDETKSWKGQTCQQPMLNESSIINILSYFSSRYSPTIKGLDIRKRVNYQQMMKRIQKYNINLLYPHLIQQFNFYRSDQYVCEIVTAYNFLLYKAPKILKKIFQIDVLNNKIVFHYYSMITREKRIQQINLEDLFNQHAREFNHKDYTEILIWKFLFKKAVVYFIEQHLLLTYEQPGIDIRHVLQLMLGSNYTSVMLQITVESQPILKKIFKLVFQFYQKELTQYKKYPNYFTINTTRPTSHCIRLFNEQYCYYPEIQEQRYIPFDKLISQQFYIGFHILWPAQKCDQLFSIFLDIFQKMLHQKIPNRLQTIPITPGNKNLKNHRMIEIKLIQSLNQPL